MDYVGTICHVGGLSKSPVHVPARVCYPSNLTPRVGTRVWRAGVVDARVDSRVWRAHAVHTRVG